MVISPGFGTLTGYLERFTKWIIGMPELDVWFAVLCDISIGGTPSEDIEILPPFSECDTRLQGFWRLYQIVIYVQVGIPDNILDSMKRVVTARQDTKDPGVRIKYDPQRGKNDCTKGDEEEDQ